VSDNYDISKFQASLTVRRQLELLFVETLENALEVRKVVDGVLHNFRTTLLIERPSLSTTASRSLSKNASITISMPSWQIPSQSAVSAYFLFLVISNFCCFRSLLSSESYGPYALVSVEAMQPLKGRSDPDPESARLSASVAECC